MKRKFLSALILILPAFYSNAITYTYGNLDSKNKTCTLLSWGGNQPTSGKLTLKETYEKDGITYKVTNIAPHALDNLTEVTEITIPANITKIGDTNEYYLASCYNFFNCPKLKKFIVASGNTVFSATEAGILVKKGGNFIVRVPSAIELKSGSALSLSKSIMDICPDAFSGNTTITTITLSPNMFALANNAGFNYMPNLSSFKEGENAKGYSVSNGILYNEEKTKILSYPPKRSGGSFAIPQGVTEIGDNAFANTHNLYSLDFGSVDKIESKAFYNCGLTKIELPSRNILIEEGAFSNCLRLTSLVLPYSINLPKNFARDSKQLSSVTALGTTKFGNCAFKGCSKLKSFNFRPDMTFDGDSIFAGCGFNEVKFGAGTVPYDGIDTGYAMFAGCNELVKIDMSGLIVNNTSNPLSIRTMFTPDCPNLKTVILPRFTSFWSAMVPDYPNFGINSSIETLVIGAFSIGNNTGHAFVYDSGNHTINVYVKTTDAVSQSWPLNQMFLSSDNAYLRPIIYCESYSMINNKGTDKYQYIVPGAHYYIPGGTRENYIDVIDHNCALFEMFSIVSWKENDKFIVGVNSELGTRVKFLRLMINNEFAGEPDANGIIRTNFNISDVNEYVLEYEVDGIEMKTKYPKPLSSSVNAVNTESDVTVREGRCIWNIPADYNIMDLSGKVLESGRDTEVCLDKYANGIYMIQISFDNDKVYVKKVIR